MPQIRANFFDLSADDRETLTDLTCSLGVDPDEIAAHFAVTVVDGRWRLHLTEFLLRNGQRFVDVAADQTASVPRVFDVTPEMLPATLRPTEAVA